MKNNYKLTSVKVIKDLYKKFKMSSLNDGLNLQKLVNRSMNLCESDPEFRETIYKHDKLEVSGSF
tara:strand:+ start:290 stop:484 length:195 start_codon:yes stop_codon:yes gene_type:complete